MVVPKQPDEPVEQVIDEKNPEVDKIISEFFEKTIIKQIEFAKSSLSDGEYINLTGKIRDYITNGLATDEIFDDIEESFDDNNLDGDTVSESYDGTDNFDGYDD